MDERNGQEIFWVESIHTIVVILNKAHFRGNNDKTPYEIWYGIPVIVKHFRVFGSKWYIKRNDDKLGKFDARDDGGIFLGYSHNNKGYRCYIKNIKNIFDSIDVQVDEYIEIKYNHPINSSSNEPVNNDEKKDEPLSNEYSE